MTNPGFWMLLCGALFTSPTLAGTTLWLEVLDDASRPLRGVVVSAEGNSSTSAPTDGSGKTYISVTQDVQPGEMIFLVLVSAPSTKLRFLQPWNGRAVAPKPPYSIEVILGVPGNRAALDNPKVVEALAWAVVSEIPNHQGKIRTKKNDPAVESLREVSRVTGLNPVKLDAAIRKRAKASGPLPGISGYVADVPTDAAARVQRIG